MLQRGVEFGQRPATVALVVKVGEAVTQADDRIVLAGQIAIQPAPVGVHGVQDHAARAPVLERLGQHLGRAVAAGDLEAGVHELHRMEAGAAGGVEHGGFAALLEQIDEELALALCAGLPVDQIVPLFHEAAHIFLDIMIGVADRRGVFSVILLIRVAQRRLLDGGAHKGPGPPCLACTHARGSNRTGEDRSAQFRRVRDGGSLRGR